MAPSAKPTRKTGAADCIAYPTNLAQGASQMRLRPRSADRNTSPANPVSRVTRRTRKSTMAVTKRLATNSTPTRKIASPTKTSKRMPWKNQKTDHTPLELATNNPSLLQKVESPNRHFPNFPSFLRNFVIRYGK